MKDIIVIVTQMVFLYKDPKGEHIFEGHNTISAPALDRKQSSTTIIELLSSDQLKVEWCTARVFELEK